jgi:5-methylcytosine-specific restriction endonuclease McrA
MGNYSEYKAAYYQRNKQRLNEKNSLWAHNNKEKSEVIKRKYRNKNKAEKVKLDALWYDENRDHKSNYSKLYKVNNRTKINAIAAKRRAALLNATPLWLTEQHNKDIEEFYILAQELAWLNQDGQPFHVDHIIPLQGVNCSGLHVPWNLQLLHPSINLSKKNKI